jgi:calcium-dependent protein kinase
MRKIMSSVNYLHSMNIIHRDLKPDNFIFTTTHPYSEIKMIDFGLACKVHRVVKMHTLAGTPYYVAPEVLNGSYGKECDYWSLGVILYVMLSGEHPFYGESTAKIFD